MPLGIAPDFDVWLSGNIQAQQITSDPALIQWTHPAFSPTPYLAGFSIQQAYKHVNDAAKEQLTEQLIVDDPRNRPLTGLLNFLLTEEFSPIGFVDNFTSTDYLTAQTFDQSVSGTSAARLSFTNQLRFSFLQQMDKLKLESSIYFVQERNPVQLTMISPHLTLNELGPQLGQAVQDRIQIPFEELLVNVGGFSTCLLYTSPSPRDRG